MNYGDPKLQSLLAAEYVLGSLCGSARRRFERLLESEPGLRAETDYWQRRLNALAETVPPVTPPDRVWRGIRRRIRSGARRQDRRRGLWPGAGFWRGFALSGVMLLIGYGLGAFQYAPRGAATPQYIAVLQNQQAKPVLVASLVNGGRTLKLEMLRFSTMAPGKVMQVWCVPSSGKPRSLGMFDSASARFTLSLRQLQELHASKAIAISLEPTGGSPMDVPSGPVMYKGDMI